MLASLLVLLLAVLISGCATRGGPVPYDVANFNRPDAERPPIADSGIISKLDTLTVKVYQAPDLDRDLQVDRDGNITLPLAGTVHADGLTAAQLADAVAARLAARYVRSPDVTVAIKETVAKQLTVEGSVRKPGIYELRGETTLLGAVALASGPDEYANTHRIVVFRQIDGTRHAAAFDLQAIRHGESPDPAIYGNDTVVVDGSKMTRVYRDVLQAVPLLTFVQYF